MAGHRVEKHLGDELDPLQTFGVGPGPGVGMQFPVQPPDGAANLVGRRPRRDADLGVVAMRVAAGAGEPTQGYRTGGETGPRLRIEAGVVNLRQGAYPQERRRRNPGPPAWR